MAELVTIPISFFEIAIDYERPQFKLWLDRAFVVQTVFEALERWGPRIEDVEGITTGKAAEQGFSIKLPLKRVSFFFGPASCKFTRDNVDWQLSRRDDCYLRCGHVGSRSLQWCLSRSEEHGDFIAFAAEVGHVHLASGPIHPEPTRGIGFATRFDNGCRREMGASKGYDRRVRGAYKRYFPAIRETISEHRDLRRDRPRTQKR